MLEKDEEIENDVKELLKSLLDKREFDVLENIVGSKGKFTKIKGMS